MTLGHEKLDVYRLSISYAACKFEKIRRSMAMAESISIPIAISIWTKNIPNQTFQATLDSAPERGRWRQKVRFSFSSSKNGH